MARLYSEDQENSSSLELLAGSFSQPEPAAGGELWQAVDLILLSGHRKLELRSGVDGAENCLICRRPEDEAGKLVRLLSELLNKQRHRVLFEPAEPSFELSLERTREGGIKVEAWIDCANSSTGFYGWDAAGIRFYTQDEQLDSFLKQLRIELAAPDATNR